MRKDVKLGMAIGGGLIVILVGYLLFAPPANGNKNGAHFVGGNSGGNGNIIDPAGPGDLVPDDKAGTKTGDLAGSPRGGVADTHPIPEGPTGKIADATPKPEEKAKPAADPWNSTLKNGAVPKGKAGTAGKGGTEPIAQVIPKDQSKAGRHDDEGQGAPLSADPPKFIYNPNDAWGGGVSSDGIVGTAHSGKSNLVASPDTTSAAGGGGTHVVKSGETLSSIALSAYGSATYYPHILRANPGINPNNLKLGTVLKMPHSSEFKVDAADHSGEHPGQPAAMAETQIDPSKQYRVVSGDSLYKISIKVYGKSSYMDKIYEKNKGLIGPDNKRLKLGMVLDLPEKATTAAATGTEATTSTLSEPGSGENSEK